MAAVTSKGSIVLEILIVVLVIALVATILYPKKIWEQENANTQNCRTNMDQIFKAELIYQKYHNNYTSNLDQLVNFIKKSDSINLVREYIQADTALAIKLTKEITQMDPKADQIIKDLLADTLMFAILETANYDSNLASVIFKRLDKTSVGSVIAAKRVADSSDVANLKILAKAMKASEILEPIKNDDSLKLVFARMMPEVSIGDQLDTLYVLNRAWAQRIDSAVFATLDGFRMCPTVNREYKITVIDTSAFKYVHIECPVDSALDIEQSKKDFVRYYFGHLRIANHGKIETGDRSWAK
ncbi:MAG: hypothetical protein ONB16_09020 [candidate division KSB1 bacterium]|nr:hypothetical protein [candidate division KSB1 bacterium]MDZ7318109.1 hypothetical protein [candidate division KSB1 bacterium]MDZ7340509.1 hypothetical protein [candidate division KSB1 bacterium]